MMRIISRNSPLALKQVEEFIGLLPDFEHEIISIKSLGDKNKKIPLDGRIPDDFFTREHDKALLSGEADIAVHLAKDIPYPLPEGLVLGALTSAFDQSDCLSGNKLSLLPSGARVGVSSISRITQLTKLRPDLVPVPIRGNIGKRLSLVEQKQIDALIVATCALKRLGMKDKIHDILPFRTHPLQGMLAAVCRKIVVSGMPEVSDSEHFYDYLISGGISKRLLYPCSDLSNNKLSQSKQIESLPVYTTEHLKVSPLDLNNFDAVVFSSPSTVDAFFMNYDKIPDHILCYVKGPATRKQLLENSIAEEHIAVF